MSVEESKGELSSQTSRAIKNALKIRIPVYKFVVGSLFSFKWTIVLWKKKGNISSFYFTRVLTEPYKCFESSLSVMKESTIQACLQGRLHFLWHHQEPASRLENYHLDDASLKAPACLFGSQCAAAWCSESTLYLFLSSGCIWLVSNLGF